MRRLRSAVLLVNILGLTLILASCSKSSLTIVGQSETSDSELSQAIRARIISDPQLQGTNLRVTANARKNQANIWGTVSTESQKLRAMDLAKSTRAGLALTESIQVQPGGAPDPPASTENKADHALEQSEAMVKQVIQQFDIVPATGIAVESALGATLPLSVRDIRIHDDIVTGLIASLQEPLDTVMVDVAEGVVTLRGRVPDMAARSAAEQVSKRAAGVKSVKNLLRVSPQV